MLCQWLLGMVLMHRRVDARTVLPYSKRSMSLHFCHPFPVLFHPEHNDQGSYLSLRSSPKCFNSLL